MRKRDEEEQKGGTQAIYIVLDCMESTRVVTVYNNRCAPTSTLLLIIARAVRQFQRICCLLSLSSDDTYYYIYILVMENFSMCHWFIPNEPNEPNVIDSRVYNIF